MATVLTRFRDRVTWKLYSVGDEWEGPPERLRELSGGGFVECGPVDHNEDETPSDGAHGGTQDISALTVAQLREVAEGRGIDVPKRATKARLLEILGA